MFVNVKARPCFIDFKKLDLACHPPRTIIRGLLWRSSTGAMYVANHDQICGSLQSRRVAAENPEVPFFIGDASLRSLFQA